MNGKPAADLRLFLQHEDSPAMFDGEPWLVHLYQFQTDADGRFALPRVLPGHIMLDSGCPTAPRRAGAGL